MIAYARPGANKLFATFLLTWLFHSIAAAQSYKPIQVSGFNHDVIAESPTASPLATTTTEMDAIDPSNFVLYTRAFANARLMEYGLPNGGRIGSGGKVFQLANYSGRNALYLLKDQQGTLTFAPQKFDEISILGLSTEGGAELDMTLAFSDGSTMKESGRYDDWFNGSSPIIQGIGRVKREDGMQPYYEGNDNPRMYAIDITLPAGKAIKSITFSNVSGNYNGASNRAVIFAVSGYSKTETTPEVIPQKKKVVVRKRDDPAPVITKKTQETIPVEPPVEKPKTQEREQLEKVEVVPATKQPETKVTEEKPALTQKEAVEKLVEPPMPVEVGSHMVLKKVLFKQSTAVLLDQSYPQLDSITDFLIKNPTIHIEVAGHTDTNGSKNANLKLSKERAAEIKSYFEKKGVAPDRITSNGYGGSKPIAPNNTEESRQLNRRVEFIITSK